MKMQISYGNGKLNIGLDGIERLAIRHQRVFKTDVNGYDLRVHLADALCQSAADFVDGEEKPRIDAYLSPEALDSKKVEIAINPLNGKKPEFSKIVLSRYEKK